MIALENVIGYVISVGAMIITVIIAMNKTRKEIQNGISQRLGALEKHNAQQSTDIRWIIKEVSKLPCVRDPGWLKNCEQKEDK